MVCRMFCTETMARGKYIKIKLSLCHSPSLEITVFANSFLSDITNNTKKTNEIIKQRMLIKPVDPLIKRLKNLVRTVLARSYQGWENYHRINNMNGRLYRENEHLKYENSKLKEVNGMLREQNKAYQLLEKVFGRRRLNEIIEQARGFKKPKQRDAR